MVVFAAMPFDAPASADPQTLRFSRGINLGDYLAYPEGRAWPLFRGSRAATSDAELRRLAAVGFTFIRLPVEPGPFLDSAAEHVPALEERLTSFVTRANAAGLAVMVSGFPRHDTPRWRPQDILRGADAAAFERYAGLLTRIAALLRRDPAAQVALELMNEPQPECFLGGGRDWSIRQKELYRRLRTAAPSLTLVLTTGCWSALDGLKHLDMAAYDANTLIDLHYYAPFAFTHQGATWTLSELKDLAGLSFPARLTDRMKVRAAISRLVTARHAQDRHAQRLAYAAGVGALEAYLRGGADAATVARHMARIAEWADRHAIARGRILIGEFGVLRPRPEAQVEDDGSRGRWLEAVRRTAEASGFGWALWAYHSRFGLLANGEAGALDDGMIGALGLTPPAKWTAR